MNVTFDEHAVDCNCVNDQTRQHTSAKNKELADQFAQGISQILLNIAEHKGFTRPTALAKELQLRAISTVRGASGTPRQ